MDYRVVAGLAAALIFILSFLWPSTTAGITVASATWHVARRCFATVRSGKLLCLAGTWRRIVADRASVPIHSISDRPPPFQRVAIVELLDEAFRKQLLAEARTTNFPWTTKRHIAYPTNDAELYLLPRAGLACSHCPSGSFPPKAHCS